MGNKKDPFHPHLCRHIQRFAYIITAFHGIFQIYFHMLPQEILSIVARRNNQIFITVRMTHLHLQTDAGNQSCFAHRHHNSTGPQNGNAALDSQTWIKGLFRHLFSSRHRDHYGNPPCIVQILTDRLHCFPNHFSWHPVNGRFSYWLPESFLGDTSYAFSTINLYTRLTASGHMCIDQKSMSCIRIIPAVLSDRTAGTFLFQVYIFCQEM